MSIQISLRGLLGLIWNDSLRKGPNVPFRMLQAKYIDLQTHKGHFSYSKTYGSFPYSFYRGQ